MKVEDVLLDIGTGDASTHDVDTSVAMGKINVSSAIFEAAYGISELPSEDITSVIQEAADSQQLPTSKEGSTAVAGEAVCHELSAFFDMLISTAKKTKDTANKSISMLYTLGKKEFKTGKSEDFLNGFVTPLTQGFKEKYPKGLEIKTDGAFIKAKYAARMAENYCKGVANIFAAYGISFDDILDKDAVKLIARSSIKSRKTVSDLRDVESNINLGTKLLSFDKTVTKDRHYTTVVRATDLQSFAVSINAIQIMSDAVIKVASMKKKSIGSIKNIIDTTNKKAGRVARSCEGINDSVKEGSQSLKSLTDNITKAYNDSIYHLAAAFGGSPKK